AEAAEDPGLGEHFAERDAGVPYLGRGEGEKQAEREGPPPGDPEAEEAEEKQRVERGDDGIEAEESFVVRDAEGLGEVEGERRRKLHDDVVGLIVVVEAV